MATSDGAGVKLRRRIGQQRGLYHDPFLMLDAFAPTIRATTSPVSLRIPHRGFETVTYMLDRHMLHEDHLGHRGDSKGAAACSG